ncbi:hypothetical protein C8F04DRAFT_1106529, partial [Mycena alexandri]
TKLTVRAVDATGQVVKMTNELSSSSLARLVSAFPNLTHLDVCLSRRISNYRKSLIRLTHLQSLRVQEYRKTSAGRWNPVTAIFPAAEYTNELRRLAPSLSQLTTVEFSVLGDNVDEGEGSSHCACGGDCEQMDSPPEMTVDYRFSVVRTSSEVSFVLRDTHVCDAR